MSIATRIEAIEQHITDDYSVLELAGADLTNVDKNIENLKQSWEERLLYFLANGLDVVWENWEKVTGTGETITLNNTIEAKMDFVYKGNTYQYSTSGKNLFDNVYGQTGNVYTKHINASNPLGSLDCYPINLLPNTQYTLKIDMNGYRKTSTWIAGVCFENGDAISLLQYNSMADITTTTFTTDSTGVVYVGQRYGFTYGETGRMDLFLQTAKIQLEKGTTATDYEPYTNGASPNPDYPQDVHVVTGDNTINIEGKNLFDINNQTVKYGYAKDGSGNDTESPGSNYTTSYTPVKPNTTYTFSFNLSAVVCRIYFYNSNKTWIDRTDNIINSSNKYTFTTPNNCYYLQFQNVINYTTGNIQLEKSNQATTYEPYQSQSYAVNLGSMELCKIGDYQDYIYKDNKKWYKYGAIGKVFLNGSENWGTQGTTNYQCALVNANKLYLARSGIGLSNYFRIGTSGTDIFLYPILQAGIDYIRISNATIKWATLDNFKAFITNNSAVFYYPLATPTTTEITDTTLISQLETIKKSYNTQTNISQTNADKPFILDVVALGNN